MDKKKLLLSIAILFLMIFTIIACDNQKSDKDPVSDKQKELTDAAFNYAKVNSFTISECFKNESVVRRGKSSDTINTLDCVGATSTQKHGYLSCTHIVLQKSEKLEAVCYPTDNTNFISHPEGK